MKILVLGDVMGASGRKALNQHLSNIIKENKINFELLMVKMHLTMAKELQKK